MAKKTKPFLKLSRKGFALWAGLIFLISAWMFILGVLVGRGTAPVQFDIAKLQEELAELQQKLLQKELAKLKRDPELGYDKTDLGFYEKLKEKKKDNRLSEDVLKKAQNPSPPKKVEKVAKERATKPAKKPTTKSAKQPAAKPAQIQANRSATTKPKSKASAKKAYTIQVASVKDVNAAKRMVNTLKTKGYPAFQTKVQIPKKGTWYRIQVGSYADQKTAKQMLSKLERNKYKGIIVNLK